MVWILEPTIRSETEHRKITHSGQKHSLPRRRPQGSVTRSWNEVPDPQDHPLRSFVIESRLDCYSVEVVQSTKILQVTLVTVT